MFSIHKKLSSYQDLHNHLQNPDHCIQSIQLTGEPAEFNWTPVDPFELLEQARTDEKVRLLRMKPADRVAHFIKDDIRKEFQQLPLEKAAQMPHFHLSLFDLQNLIRPGRVLHDLHEQVIKPFEQRLRNNEFAWEQFYPVLFITGPDSGTNYHIDPHTTATFHLFGPKQTFSLIDPRRWCPQPIIDAYRKDDLFPTRPMELKEEDCCRHDNNLGDMILFPESSPHWTEASVDQFSGTITFVLKGLSSAKKINDYAQQMR